MTVKADGRSQPLVINRSRPWWRVTLKSRPITEAEAKAWAAWRSRLSADKK